MIVLSKESIKLDYYASDWRDAVSETGRLLVKAGITTEQYIDAMLEIVETHGAYMLVAPGIAMPHAHFLKGTLRTGISFLTLKEPVVFPKKESNKIRLLIGVAAEDNNVHLDVIAHIAEIIMEESSRLHIMNCKDLEEICRIMNN